MYISLKVKWFCSRQCAA